MYKHCPPPKALLGGGVLAWRLGSGANHEDAQTNKDHAGGHSTDEDLEGDHHFLCLLAGSCLIPCKPGETPPLHLSALLSTSPWVQKSLMCHPTLS